MTADHRPRAHLHPLTGWINDPIAPLRWGDRVHLFCQHNPHAASWAAPHWAHFSTGDLVHWRPHPIALSPDPAGVDAAGCYSGSAAVADGVATILYTGVSGPLGPHQRQVTCVATSNDPDLDRWERHPDNPVTVPPADDSLLGFRDPFVFRQGDRWVQLVGSGRLGSGGLVFGYTSSDLRAWEPLGVVLAGDVRAREPVWTGSMWECPQLLRFGQQDALLVSVHDGELTHYAAYFLGRFDGTRFTPSATGRLDHGPDHYAPCMLRDGDRWLTWGWSWEARAATAVAADGWAGVLTLPRVLRPLDGGRLGVQPAPEVEHLRAAALPLEARRIADGWRWAGAAGDALEIALTLPAQPGAGGLRVRASADGAERTVITYDRSAGLLTVDREKASLDPAARRGRASAPLDLAGEDLRLRVWVDRSMVEVYAADEICLTTRVYPTRRDATGVEVFGSAGAPEVGHAGVWALGDALQP
jgi:beta-fructofuranosidase